jgi:hypothetical protein
MSLPSLFFEEIQCEPSEPRIIPNFFEKVYEINKKILEKIKKDYKEIELSQTQDSKLEELSKKRSTRFLKKIIDEIELKLEDYLEKYPNDDDIEHEWEEIYDLLVSTPLTKRRLQVLRKIKKQYKKDLNWKELIKNLKEFLSDKGVFEKKTIEPFDDSKLKLKTIDFIS